MNHSLTEAEQRAVEEALRQQPDLARELNRLAAGAFGCLEPTAAPAGSGGAPARTGPGPRADAFQSAAPLAAPVERRDPDPVDLSAAMECGTARHRLAVVGGWLGAVGVSHLSRPAGQRSL